MFRRILAILLLVVLAAGTLIAFWPQLFGLQRVPVAAQVVSLRGLAAALSLFLVLALVVLGFVFPRLRRFFGAIAAIGLLFVVSTGVLLAVRGLGSGGFHHKGDSDLTIFSWNTLGDVPGSMTIANAAIDAGADVVVLPETTSETAIEVARIMGAAGHPMWVHTFSYDLISKSRSTSLLLSTSLGKYNVDLDHRTTQVLPSLVATPADGTGPTIVAVHVVAPNPSQVNHWKLDLTWLESICSGKNVIVAGDFNSTIDHYWGLGSNSAKGIGNCLDAGVQSGNAAVGTWPTNLPPWLGAPIDHVMATDGWQVTGMRVLTDLDGAGSDHRPIVVQLMPLR
ncbi:MAG: endonuclease/exonuclease/phosphatase family protein [Cryobacterium sp.]|nr:endonuclease/exonuclease/phosphatase family protein [Cryobacterium sp.]MCC7127509.1 endonuclease/exonuclease/phosphatase family protein [Microbacteriaceae bacterium]MCO5293569.1 endonuclease/exonuclease/phosphatase family protein [Homoserinimonas sp.]MBX3090223.1 endonuclease/exonuclease/phosphatase family protein [Cryobacterium sp.]MBX3116529.1 endonuclease/exonuclease/phosphatase family protein [Cryobacterium sp.]